MLLHFRMMDLDSYLNLGKTVVVINVGGTEMTTLYGTLTEAFPDSKIAKHFLAIKPSVKIFYVDAQTNERKFKIEQREIGDKGELFLDTDPLMFVHVLNLLRRPDLLKISGYCPEGVSYGDWQRELRYWGIVKCVDQ